MVIDTSFFGENVPKIFQKMRVANMQMLVKTVLRGAWYRHLLKFEKCNYIHNTYVFLSHKLTFIYIYSKDWKLETCCQFPSENRVFLLYKSDFIDVFFCQICWIRF